MKDNNYNGNEIAVIGMSGRFPGAGNINEYWYNLKTGTPAITFLTDDELNSRGVDSTVRKQPNFVNARAMLEGIDLFDASFFGYTPREAQLMDPQHRIFLECAWEALESAGYTPAKSDELISVFASSTLNTYLICNLLSNREMLANLDPVQIDISNGNDYLATRVSYKLNLKGMSCTVQTACSSSLVAVHLACQNLLNAESDIALAGGISIDIRQRSGYLYYEGSILSPDGYCRAFDAKANGTIFGSGAGIVVLRRLKDALKNKDTIFAIIKGSAINNDGMDKVGYTAPSVAGQAAVIAEAMAVAECDPATISYIETHGTGTKMGDPIEIRALKKAFSTTPPLKKSCAIGSVKTQIGHLAGAAGISSLIKTILALYHKKIPASLNFQTPNPELNLNNSPFYVNTELTDWNHPILRAGVSSFGVGGTNAHFILEQAPAFNIENKTRGYHLIPLSARTKSELIQHSHNIADTLTKDTTLNLADVAFTMQCGRKDFQYRTFVVCKDGKDTAEALKSLEQSKIKSASIDVENRPVIFILSGNESLHSTVTRELYENDNIFKAEYDKCLDILNTVLNRNKQNKITKDILQNSDRPLILKQINLFMISYIITSRLLSIAIIPEAMIGIDIGEYTTACLAGVLSIEQVFMLLLVQAKENEKSNEYHTEDFKEKLKETTFDKPRLPFISHFSGTWINETESRNPEYWLKARLMNKTLSAGLHLLKSDNHKKVLLQIGQCERIRELVKDSFSDSFIYQGFGDNKDGQVCQSSLMNCLGTLWLSGVKINWQDLYKNKTGYRITLPAYPFNRQRYWIETSQYNKKDQSQAKLTKKENPGDWLYFPGWKNSPFPGFSLTPKKQDRWLLFCDKSEFSQAIIRYLTEINIQSILVYPDTSYQKLTENTYAINPGQQSDYTALFVNLKNLDLIPTKIIHLWSINTNMPDKNESDFFHTCRIKGFWSVIQTGLAIKELALQVLFRIQVISNHILCIESNDIIYPEKATLLAPIHVIPCEYPNIDCQYLDMSLDNILHPDPRHIIRIINEIQTPGTDRVIAYRGNQRWSRNYDPIRPGTPLRKIRRQGVYLVLDDTNGICLFLAEHLLKKYEANIILLENSLFPDRNLWQQEIQAEHKNSFKLRKILELEKSGQFKVLSADVTNIQHVEEIINQAEQQHGTIHGIIDGADDIGNIDFCPLHEANTIQPENLLDSKMKSMYNLGKIFSNRKLDFFMHSSSLASVLGGSGQIINAAQCFFIDNYVLNSNMNVISVNWDIWEIPGNNKYIKDKFLKNTIQVEDGIKIFEKILTNYAGKQISVSTVDLNQRIRQQLKIRNETDAAIKKQEIAKHPRPELKNPYIAPSNKVEEKIAEIWGDALGIEDIGIDDDFYSLGGHSLLITQLFVQTQNLFQIEFPMQILFENSTIRILAQKLEEYMGQKGIDTGKPILEQLKITFPTEQKGLLINYLKNKIAAMHNINADEISQALNPDTLEFDEKNTSDLMLSIKKDFNLQVFPHEIKNFQSIDVIAQFILDELERFSNIEQLWTGKKMTDYSLNLFYDKKRDTSCKIMKKNKPMVFLHSSPRAGSTLLRTMLAGHSRLFCPPELNILFFETMQNWKESVGFGHKIEWTNQGLHWAIIELFKIGPDEGWEKIDDFVKQNLTIQDLYAQLQELCGNRILVDKTPPYCLDMKTLCYAEEIFDKPKYIHLCRHPYSVMESMLRMRLDKLFSRSLYMTDDIDPYVVTEAVWNISNRNLLDFTGQIDKERMYLLRFEELVKEPEKTMQKLCEFMEIPFEASVLSPYDGRKERMLVGLGDPNILTHNSIDPRLADVWKNIKIPYSLDVSTKEIASTLGYELHEHKKSEKDQDRLIDDLDKLSEAEIDSLLDAYKPEEMKYS